MNNTEIVACKRPHAALVHVAHDSDRPDLQLFEHQEVAVNRYKDSDCIALFFEMGCGKSLTTLRIAQEKFKQGKIKGMLVIAPNDVHKQWYDDLVFGVDIHGDGVRWQELQIDFEAQCVGGRGGASCLVPFESVDTFKFVSVNVDTFSRSTSWKDITEWANSDNYMIVVDEATVIKNISSNRSQRIIYGFNDVTRKGRTIIKSVKKHPVRVVLTGTPITNGAMDLWSIMEFVQPNFFNRNIYSFKEYYCMCTRITVSSGGGIPRNVDVLLTEKTWQGIHNCSSYEHAFVAFGCSEDTYLTVKSQNAFLGPFKHADDLVQKLSPVATFVKLVDCVDMPKTMYVTRNVGMSPAQLKAYTSMKERLLATCNDYVVTAGNKLTMLTRLQQISSGFIVGKKSNDLGIDIASIYDGIDTDEQDLLPDEIIWLDKTNPRLDALMRDVAESDKPTLILTRYTAEAAKIYELCNDAGYKTGLFTGWKVIGGIEAFKEGKLDVLVANSAKVSRGFNLQVAHVTLFYSNTFSMEIRQQAEFRTFRLGQKQPCLYIDYLSSNVDKVIFDALRMKKYLLEYVRTTSVEQLLTTEL